MQSPEGDLRKRDDPVQPAGITVPVNYGAYTNGSFPPTSFTLSNVDLAQSASFYAFGGASWITYIPPLVPTRSGSQSSTIFVPGGQIEYTRVFSGSGNRSTIYGSARWGSGDGDVQSQSPHVFIPNETLDNPNRGYPYGFWPLYWGSINYAISNKFGSSPFRPGGEQNLLIAGLNETRQNAYYFIIGDKYTIKGLNTILALPYERGGCSMWSGNPIYLFEPDSLSPNGTKTLRSATGSAFRQNITIVPQNILQYYRASSVALGSNLYVNEFSLDNNTRPEYWGRTPFDVSVMLPNVTGAAGDTGVNRTLQETRFLDCLNQTIAAAVPIVDGFLSTSTNTPRSDNAFKFGIGIGVPLAVIGLFIICCWRYNTRSSVFTRRAPFRPGGPTSARIIDGDRSTHVPMSARPARRRQTDAEEDLPVYVPRPQGEGTGEEPPAYTADSNDRRTPAVAQTRD